MKFFNYKYVSIIFCLFVLFNNCSNTGSKSSAEKTDNSPEQTVAEDVDDSPEKIILIEKADVSPEQIALIEKVLLHFQEGHFDKIVSYFDDNVKTQINEGQLAAVWERMNTQIGKYSTSEFYKAEKLINIGERVVYKCNFGTYQMYFELVFGKDNKIAGIFFKPK